MYARIVGYILSVYPFRRSLLICYLVSGQTQSRKSHLDDARACLQVTSHGGPLRDNELSYVSILQCNETCVYLSSCIF